MYWLARQLTILTTIALGYSLLLMLVLFGPCAWMIGGAVLVALVLLRRSGRLTTLGSARWADRRDLERAGLLHSESGPILGRIDPLPVPAALREVWFARLPAETVMSEWWGALHRKPGSVLRLSRAVHTVYFAPSGVGKGVSAVIPFLLTCPESCVVIDFKGENAQLTAAHRAREFGHQVVILDPFHVTTKNPDTFNPLDFIDPSSVFALDECNSLAKSLVVRTGQEKEPHWNDAAEAWIAAFLAVVVFYGQRNQTRSLQTVREMFSDPDRLQLAIKLMRESDAASGMLARIGGQLLHFVDREKSSTLTTVSQHLRFLDTQAIAQSTETSSFDPAKLRSGKTTIYLILPPDHMRAQSALLRMWIGSLLKAVVRGGLGETAKVHFVLDEAASLGALEPVEDAIDKFRGYGVRLQLFYQSMGQLKRCFPDGQDQTLLSNTTQVFFGVNDNQTAEYVSARLGEATIVVESGGSSHGTSWQMSNGAQSQDSYSSSHNNNHNWSQQARKLLKPEEVQALPSRTAITFTPGVPPIWTTLLRFYEEPQLGKRRGWLQRWREATVTLVASGLLCGCACVLAAGMMAAVLQQTAASDWQPPTSGQPIQNQPLQQKRNYYRSDVPGGTVSPWKGR
jgi:type IV secretion system protein VirD4